MTTVAALKKAVTETLENNGVVGKLKAELRGEVFKALEDPSTNKPKLSNENLLINELIREYLHYNRYKYAESVLVAEAGHPDAPLDRTFLCKELNVVDTESSSQVPLLYSLVDNFATRRKSSAASDERKLVTSKAEETKLITLP